MTAGTTPLKGSRLENLDCCTGLQVTISYGPLRPDEAALYYGYPLHDATDERGGARLCAVDHAQYDPELRPGKQEWPEFSGMVGGKVRPHCHVVMAV